MKCNICGGEIPSGESVCKFCGNVMPENKKPESKPEARYEISRTQYDDIDVPVDAKVYRNNEFTRNMYCTKCGRPLDGATNKCIVCDRHEVSRNSYETQRKINVEENHMAKKKAKKNKHTTRNIILSILGLIALFAVTLLFTIGPMADYMGIGFKVEDRPTPEPMTEQTQKPQNTWEPERITTPTPTETVTKKPERTATPQEEGDPVELRGGEYMYDSHTHLITEGELDELTRQEIKYIYWEIFARHGLTFDSDELVDYFEIQQWYIPTVSTEEEAKSQFNDIEKRNEKTIFNYQKKMGWR